MFLKISFKILFKKLHFIYHKLSCLSKNSLEIGSLTNRKENKNETNITQKSNEIFLCSLFTFSHWLFLYQTVHLIFETCICFLRKHSFIFDKYFFLFLSMIINESNILNEKTTSIIRYLIYTNYGGISHVEANG